MIIKNLKQFKESLKIDYKKAGVPSDKKIMINDKEINPYEIGLDILSVWSDQILNSSLQNIEGKNQAVFKLAYNRIINKLFPLITKYIIPNVLYEGKEILKEEKIEPKTFWSEVWPKFWDEFSVIERWLISKYTILNKETSYEELLSALGETLSSKDYNGYVSMIGEVLDSYNELFGKTFSQIFNEKKVDVSNTLLGELIKDINSKIQGSKIPYQVKQEKSGGVKDIDNMDLSAEAKSNLSKTVIKKLNQFSEEAFDKEVSKEPEGEKSNLTNIFPKNVETEQDLKDWAKNLSAKQFVLIQKALNSRHTVIGRTSSSSGSISGRSGDSQVKTNQSVLKMGSKSEEVGRLQDKLGMKVGNQRTTFGPKTVEEVKRFQRENGLKPDGIVGPKTREKLGI